MSAHTHAHARDSCSPHLLGASQHAVASSIDGLQLEAAKERGL